LDAFPYLEYNENIANSQTQPPPPPLPLTETFPCTVSPRSDYIAATCERDAYGCLETNIQNNPYYLFETREEFKYIQCVINQRCIKTYYDNLLKEENTPLHFRSFKNGDGIQKLVATIADEEALWVWELPILEDMRWNDNHKWLIKYWSQDIINSMRSLIRQPADAEHLIYAPLSCFHSETPPTHRYTEMHTADWEWEP
jgi:hypothetical protein